MNKVTGRKGEEEKDFHFQMMVIYAMFKLTAQVPSTTIANNLAQISQLHVRSSGNTSFPKIRKCVNSSNT